MYTTLDKLVEYVIEIKTDKNFSLPLLYANSGWHYGKIEDSSILMGDNVTDFINKIKEKYPPTSKHQLVEIISQIPLPTTKFKIFFVSNQSGEYKNKYLKYKNKYLKLKQYYLSKK